MYYLREASFVTIVLLREREREREREEENTTTTPLLPKKQNKSTRLSFIFSRTGSVSRALEYRAGGF